MHMHMHMHMHMQHVNTLGNKCQNLTFPYIFQNGTNVFLTFRNAWTLLETMGRRPLEISILLLGAPDVPFGLECRLGVEPRLEAHPLVCRRPSCAQI